MTKKEREKSVKDLLHFMEQATAPFQVVEESKNLLVGEGFEQLELSEPWKLKQGGAYVVPVYGTTLFAFCIGKQFQAGSAIHAACAHTDHPCLRVKPKADLCSRGYMKLDVEVYGGAILNTWLDRPLSIAGQVTLKSDDLYEPVTKLVDWKRPILTIPNLAIHMNREVNNGVRLNEQSEMLPLISMVHDQLEQENFFIKLLAKECGVSPEDILDFDLYVYNAEKGCVLGAHDEFVSAPRLDNLTSCYACLQAVTAAAKITDDSERLNLIALYDNEEIGSRTKQGADSLVANFILEKIYDGLSYDRARLVDSYFKSMMLSLDVAHAHHPNYEQKSDPNLRVICGQGPAIKLSYSQRYATDTKAVGIVSQICEANHIPYQKFVNRSDMAGGSTLGTITSAFLPMLTVDLGIGVLAMHSARELMAGEDQAALNTLVYCFFL